MKPRLDDYIDADVSYFLGLVTGRGMLLNQDGLRQVVIDFPYSSIRIDGLNESYDQETGIRLGIETIRERLQELLDTNVKTQRLDSSIQLIFKFTTNNMMWRNLLLQTNNATSYPYFEVPQILFDPELPREWGSEFIKGYADVAGNIRYANRFVDNRNRVRLDVLNYRTNWKVPVQLCTLLQTRLNIPVQLITWGHPNMNRNFREHQVNIFAHDFLAVGFTMPHKQRLLQEFAESDRNSAPERNDLIGGRMCPGIAGRRVRRVKAADVDENNTERLDPSLVSKHFDGYYQICAALGCRRVTDLQLRLDVDDELLDSE